LRVLRRKKKSRSNRQPRAAARGRPPPWSPLPWLAVRGRSTRPPPVPGSTQPSSKRPFDLQRSAATGEGCGGTLPPRCTPAHARASSGTSVRLLSPCTHSACDRGPPAPMPAWHLRDAPGGCHPAAAVLLVSAAIGKTLVGDEGREESTARAERSGAGAFRQAPWGAARGGKAQRPFERVAAPTGGRNDAWQPSGARGQSSGDAASAAALTGPRAAAQTGTPFRPLVREL
jgi:hypothetical protein